MARLRVAAVQMEHGSDLAANLRRARAHLDASRDEGVRLALLPEYFAGTRGPGGPVAEAEHTDTIRGFLADASRDLSMAVVANVVERRDGLAYNVGVAYDGGRAVALQDKVHPMPREAESGITPGRALRASDIAGVPTGLLVCADILYPEAARILALQGAQLLLNPVMSSYREVDPTKEAREMLYVARAYDAGAFVIKAGGFARGGPSPIAGRSLITAPWGMLARYKDDFSEQLLVADLDFDLLGRFREGQARFPERNTGAYGDLL